MLVRDVWQSWDKVKAPRVLSGKYYKDPIRKKYILATPEETVRQRVIKYLTQFIIGASAKAEQVITCEDSLSHYGLETQKRADIVIRSYDDDIDAFIPEVVIECKAPDIYIGESEIDQVIEYAELLECNYAVITNGEEIFCWHYTDETKEYEPIKRLPSYLGILDDSYVLTRGTVAYTLDGDDFVIGDETEEDIVEAMWKLHECCTETRRKMPSRRYKLFRLIEDLGLRRDSYSNPSGGKFYGFYRAFLVAYKDNTVMVSFKVSCYNGVKTCLCVATDNGKLHHHALQYVADDHLAVNEDYYQFYHSGRMSKGKISELREFIHGRMPKLIEGNKFLIGSLPKDMDWYLDAPVVTRFFANLIAYALLRDEFHQRKKSQ